MLFIENGNVYEKIEVVTETQVAEVTTYRCPEFKVVISFLNGNIIVEYKDWQDNHVDTSMGFIFRFANHTLGISTKYKVAFTNGFYEFPVSDVGEYSASVTVDGTDGGNLFFEIE